ncbi:MAG: sigma-70 family RNA polymerase sigma factor [Defluviitaleaceae bacterium]|nr:sigma-70 family RNA polymerase sigma factor [Defluviitaleaceae bacterium]
MTLEEAVTKYSAVLFKYCYGVLCDYHEAQDAVQETFVKAFTKKASYREDTNYAGWLYRIAYNTCISMIRKKRFNILGKFGDVSKNESGSTHSLNEENFFSEELQKALDKISPRDRALIFSRALDDLDFKQLEAVYKTNAATLRKRYERAKKKLQKNMEEKS